MSMTFEEYSNQALLTADYPDRGANTIYPALKLCGEAGEVAEKIGKLWRNKGQIQGVEYEYKDTTAIALELGDVLWYVAALCDELNIEMEVVAAMNLDKLKDRKERGVIKSEGDNR